jgi:hypothetical protein
MNYLLGKMHRVWVVNNFIIYNMDWLTLHNGMWWLLWLSHHQPPHLQDDMLGICFLNTLRLSLAHPLFRFSYLFVLNKMHLLIPMFNVSSGNAIGCKCEHGGAKSTKSDKHRILLWLKFFYQFLKLN